MAHIPLSFVLYLNAATWSQHPPNFNQGSISAVFPVPSSGTTGKATLPGIQAGLIWDGSDLLVHIFSLSFFLDKMKTKYIGFIKVRRRWGG